MLNINIQEKLDELKREIEAPMLMQSLLGLKAKRQIFLKKLDRAQSQHISWRLLQAQDKDYRVKNIFKGQRA